MAWVVNGFDLTMTAGDFGVEVPFRIKAAEMTLADTVRFTIKRGDEIIVDKEYSHIANNTVNVELTAAESALLPVGAYIYVLDWYQNGHFMCNIIRRASFKVVGKG